LYRRSLEIKENKLGESHPDLVSLLNNYALMLRRSKRDEEAKQLEARAKAISEATAAVL
jgi:hemerythrin